MNDNSIMPYGKYQGKKMANIPATYLLWLLDNHKGSDEVTKYITDNLDVLRSEIKIQIDKYTK